MKNDLGCKQKLIGMISKDLQRLKEAAPNAHDEILTLSKDISQIINKYMLDDQHYPHKENIFEDRLK